MAKNTYRSMIAEGLREIGVLLMVFGPIASAFENHETGMLLWMHLVSFIIGGIALFVTGAVLEVKSNG